MIAVGGTGSRPCSWSSPRHPRTQPTVPSPPATYQIKKRYLNSLNTFYPNIKHHIEVILEYRLLSTIILNLSRVSLAQQSPRAEKLSRQAKPYCMNSSGFTFWRSKTCHSATNKIKTWIFHEIKWIILTSKQSFWFFVWNNHCVY